MVALHTVIGVLLGVMESPRDLLLDHRFQCLGQAGDDFDWFVMGEQCGLEELAGCWLVAAFGDEYINDLAVLIDSSVNVSLGACDFDVGFINEPTCANNVATGPGRVNE